MTPEQLWEKYSSPILEFVSKREFLAALAEYGEAYGEAVRAEAVKEKPKEIDPNKWAFDLGLESY